MMQLNGAIMSNKKIRSIIKIVSIVFLEIGVIAFIVYNRQGIAKNFQPILIGLILAYIINPLVKVIEKGIIYLLNKCNKLSDKFKHVTSRILSIFVALAFVLSVIVFVFVMLVPEIVDSVTQLSKTLPDLISSEINAIAEKFDINAIYDTVIKNLSDSLVKIATSVSTGAANMVISTVSTVVDVFIGFIITAYVLFSKETLLRHSKKLIYASIKNDSTINIIFDDIKDADKIFSSFFIGKILDALIVGIVCFIIMMILGLPYAVLVSVIVALTNIIPFFGPIIGGVPCAILIMLNDFWAGIYFTIMIIILQFIDGYFLQPRILGSTTGLSPLWVMISILVFGGLFGFVGMIFGVPILSVIFMLIRREVNRRIEVKLKAQNSTSVPEEK